MVRSTQGHNYNRNVLNNNSTLEKKRKIAAVAAILTDIFLGCIDHDQSTSRDSLLLGRYYLVPKHSPLTTQSPAATGISLQVSYERKQFLPKIS